MTPKLTPVLLPKGSRENDLIAKAPQSTVSSGPSMSSTSSSSLPHRPETVVMDGDSGKVLLRGSNALKDQLLSMTVQERMNAFLPRLIENENAVMFNVLMSLKGQIPNEEFTARARALLPHCELPNNRIALEGILQE